MKLEKLSDLVIKVLQDNKADDIQSLDVSGINSIADLMIIASGTSSRQIISLAEKITEEAKKNKVQSLGLEGKQYGTWVLIDFGDIIVHIMHPETREYYQLEELWSSKAQPIQSTVH